jgi:hypothetical protein
MALWSAIGVLIPVLLVFARRSNTPVGWVVLRCFAAFFVAWTALMLGSEHYVRERAQILFARGAVEESVALDGVTFGSYFLGWIPALLFIVALAFLRRLAIALRGKGLPGFTIALGTLAIAIGAFSAWRLHRNGNFAPLSLQHAIPKITEVTIYSVQAPVKVNDWEPFRTAGRATMPLEVFISAAKSAQYSGPDASPTEPGLVTFVDFDFGSDRRARLGENYFAFEGLDGFFTVTGRAGEEYRRQFGFAKEAAFRAAHTNAASSKVE